MTDLTGENGRTGLGWRRSRIVLLGWINKRGSAGQRPFVTAILPTEAAFPVSILKPIQLPFLRSWATRSSPLQRVRRIDLFVRK